MQVKLCFFTAASIAIVLLAPAASAQTTLAAPAWTSGGYNNSGANTSQAFQANPAGKNNTLIVNGEIQNSSTVTLASPLGPLSGGAGLASAGAGSATTTAIGNLLSVQISGSGNTVVINSKQTNSAAVSATTSK